MKYAGADSYWMTYALNLAEKAEQQGEVPVGAVLLNENQEILAEGWNQPIASVDPTAHAEILVLRKAAQVCNNYRLLNTTLYVTLEPCIMCTGAILHARIKRLVFGAYDLRAGAIESAFNIPQAPTNNHRFEYVGGVNQAVCRTLLQDFFKKRR